MGNEISAEDLKRMFEDMLRPLHEGIDAIAAAAAMAGPVRASEKDLKRAEIERRKQIYKDELRALDDGT